MTTTPHSDKVTDLIRSDIDLKTVYKVNRAERNVLRYRRYHALFVVAYIPLLAMIPLALFYVHDNTAFWFVIPSLLYLGYWHYKNQKKLTAAIVASEIAQDEFVNQMEQKLKAGIGDTSTFERYFGNGVDYPQ